MKYENLYEDGCIRTYTGIYFNILNPTEDMVNIRDIAWSLSNQQRFGGHLPVQHSVANHCINCMNFASTGNKLQRLMHDASEAYLMDLPSPVKKILPQYKELEEGIMSLIFSKYGIEFPLIDSTKSIDKIILELEWQYIFLEDVRDFNKTGIIRLTNHQSYVGFLTAFHSLTNYKFINE